MVAEDEEFDDHDDSALAVDVEVEFDTVLVRGAADIQDEPEDGDFTGEFARTAGNGLHTPIS